MKRYAWLIAGAAGAVLISLTRARGGFPGLASRMRAGAGLEPLVPRLLLLLFIAAVAIPTVLTTNRARKGIGFFSMTGATLSLIFAMKTNVPHGVYWLVCLAGMAAGAVIGAAVFGKQLLSELNKIP